MATRLVTTHVEEVGSTQAEARRLAADGDARPLLLVADRQTAGRGRIGRHWVSAPRAVACSLVTAPSWDLAMWNTIPLVAGLAAREALVTNTGAEVGLKWPNDVVTSAGKVGGLLAETEGEQLVIGFGANLWWPEAPPGAAALYDDDPGPRVPAAVAADWADRVLDVLAGPPANWGHAEYRAACLTVGTKIVWEPDGFGKAVNVAADGGLVVSTPAGRRTLYSGEVHSVRLTTLAPGPGSGGKRPTP